MLLIHTSSTQADSLSGKMTQLHEATCIFWPGTPLTQTSGVTQTLKKTGLCGYTNAVFMSFYCEMVTLRLDNTLKMFSLVNALLTVLLQHLVI